jgi:hypothetical protein
MDSSMRHFKNALSSAGLCAAVLLAGAACVQVPAACPPAMVWGPPPPPAAPPPAAPPASPPADAPPAHREKVAVLPLEEELLFRAERADLRGVLATKLTSIATDFAVLPLAEVDAKLRPVSPTTGARCAFEGEPAERRAREQGWLATDLLHVSGWKDKPEELWVQILGSHRSVGATWTAPWDPKLNLMARYRASFAALARDDSSGVLGGLAASGSDQGALREGPITVCEKKNFGACDAISAAWKDKAGDLAGCFADEDAAVSDVLLEGGAAARCEIANLNVTDGREGRREACLCRALMGSAGLSAKAGRRVIRVGFEAADLAGKPYPELRVVESSTNLDSDIDYHSIRTEREGKPHYLSLRRLVVDNIDALAAPLARCAAAGGGRAVIADIEVREDGSVGATRVLTAPLKPAEAACLDKALRRGAFTCTRDGKAATVKVAIAWPGGAR